MVRGLLLVGTLVGGGFAAGALVPAVSPQLWAMGLGVAVAAWPRGDLLERAAPGVRVAATHLLRAGVALLGLRVSLGQLAQVGAGGAAVAAGTIVVTLGATLALGRRLGIGDRLALLIATGSAICGASAIAAMDAAGAGRARREEEVGYAVATVTLFGTVAMLALPLACPLLGLSDAQAGMWAGGSIHEVAQVTAAGAVISTGALKIATLVKLCRVVMLGPAVALLGGGRSGGIRVPWFVVAFLALACLRSSVTVPGTVTALAASVSAALLAAGLAALGLGVRPGALHAAGVRPLVLGVAAWATAATTALALAVVVA